MKRNIPLLLFLCFIFQMNAQSQTVNITGAVFDDVTKEVIEMASIRVMNAKDSSYVTGAATGDDGKFSVDVKPGRYIAQVSFMGYINQYFPVNARNAVSIGNIYLKEDAIMLKEAVVTAKAIEIQVKGDTVEYNADSYKVQQSAVVEDLLKRMPGAEVDSDGKITINGKEIKKILVDGKEFFSSDPKVASKNLPAAMVDKLQVLDRKSDMTQMTGFDDGDEETVINLTIKKGMKQGLYGSATAGMGNDGRYGVSGIANYMQNSSQFTLMGGSNNTNNAGFTDNVGNSFRGMRGGRMNFGGQNGIMKSTSGGLNFALNPSNKLKWGGNIRYGNTNNDAETDSYTRNYTTKDPKGDIYESMSGVGNNRSNNLNSDFRFEWTPDSLTRVIFSPTFQFGGNTNVQRSTYSSTYLNPSDTVNWGTSEMYSDGNSKSLSGRLDVSRQLNNKGRVLSFSISGGYNDLENDGTNWSKTMYRKVNGVDSLALIDQIYNQKNNGYNWRGYVSYVEPIGRNNFLQLNYTYRKNYSESDKNAFKNDGFGNYRIIDTASTRKLENNFVNQEIGINFRSVREKYNYTIGLALQPSNMRSTTITPKLTSEVPSNVLNYAPIAQFNYIWNKRRNLRVNYNGSTNQPTTAQLSDVRDESNPTNITYGNPNLKPSFSNNIRLRYQDSNPEQGSMLFAFGGVNFSNNDIVTRTIRKEDGTRETTYANINGNWGANLRVMMNRPLKNKKFSFSSMTFGSYQKSVGLINEDKNTSSTLTLMEVAGIQYRSDLLDFGLRGNLSYTDNQNTLQENLNRTVYNYGGIFNTTVRLPYDFTFDSDITYSANSGVWDRFKLNSWVWNAGIYKQLFKAKNGTLKLNLYDIFNQQTNISQSPSASSYSESITNALGRYFMVSFSYRFQYFKGGAKRTDMEGDGVMPMRGPGPGGHPGGGRGPGGPMMF